MKFTPIPKEELAKQQGILIAGEADFTIDKAEETVAKKSGNPMLKLELKVWDKNGTEGKVWDYIVDSARWKILQLCDSIGRLELYDAGEVTPYALEGQSGKCIITVEKNEHGERAKIKSYFPKVASKEEVKKEIKKKDDVPNYDEDGDIPF